MSEQAGVPADEVTAKDFIMVRAALVKRLGGANEALVWSRIEYRSGSARHAYETVDGQLWWAASAATIGTEVGLSEDQVKHAIKKLRRDGYLLAEQHHGSDRTMAYSPVILHSADMPDGIPSRTDAPSIGERSAIQSAPVPDAPSTETEKTVETTPVVPAASPDDLFAMAWANWPKKTDKKASREKFLRALKTRPSLPDEVCRFGIAYRQTTPTQFVPALAAWINRARWDDELPQPRDGQKTGVIAHGRTVHDILRDREQGSGKAIAS